MISSRNIRLASAFFAVIAVGIAASGCTPSEGDKAVSEEVKKSTAASGASGTSPYGKVGTESKMPPLGKPPEPGADMSKRGANVPRPAQ